jgi:WhiB family redox-sensing transcriptional regulator
VEVAKRICATCPVKEPCLEYALEYRIDHGVWGGTTERQRRRILRKRGHSDPNGVIEPLGI